MNLKVAAKLTDDANEVVRKQLDDLVGLDDQETLGKIAELVSIYGSVQAVNKMGEDSFRNKVLKIYIISFYKDSDAQKAIVSLGDAAFGKTSMVLRLH